MRVHFVNRAGPAIVPSNYRSFLRRLAVSLAPPPGDLNVLFCKDGEIAALNRAFGGKNGPTDVLSFQGGGATAGGRVHIGDLAISVETAARAARKRRTPLAREIEALLAHGLLHLLGFDHETDDGTMMRRQAGALLSARPSTKGRR